VLSGVHSIYPLFPFTKGFKETAGRSAHAHIREPIRLLEYPPFNPPYVSKGLKEGVS
jgi:hypothetical protein